MEQNDLQLANQCLKLVQKDFNLPEAPDLEEDPFLTLRAYLTNVVSQLLTEDFNGLLSRFYRIDLSEEKVNEVLHGPSTNVAEGLADLILEREKEKVITRTRYSS